ncbi:E3 ubiquitin-protein ligase MARCHF2-like [Haemaphysalis longicornis]
MPCGAHIEDVEGNETSAVGHAPCKALLQSTPISTRRSGIDRQPPRSPRSFLPNMLHVHVPSAPSGTAEEAVPASPLLSVGAANVTASSGPMCRICHEGDHESPLLSICRCSGTMGLVHLLCLEQWLGASGSDTCELCHYRFQVELRPRRFGEWLRTSNVRRCFLGDVVCFGLLSPLAFLCGVLCLHGAAQQVLLRRLWESLALTALAFLLFAVYSAWTILTFRYHYHNWTKWRTANPCVKVVDAPRRLGLAENDGECFGFKDRESTVPPTAPLPTWVETTSLTLALDVDSRFDISSPNTGGTDSPPWEYLSSRL